MTHFHRLALVRGGADEPAGTLERLEGGHIDAGGFLVEEETVHVLVVADFLHFGLTASLPGDR